MTAKINQKYVYGIHSVTSVIKSDNESIIKVYFKKQANSKNLKILQNLALENSLLIEEIDTDKLTLMSGSTKHQGVVCQLSIDNLSSFNLNTFLQLAENPLILILDSIKDPGNLGACIRTANAAGCQLVIKRKSNSSPITAAVHKSSCGGTSNIYIYETNDLNGVVKTLKKQNITVIGTDHKSKTNYTDINGTKFQGICIIMGSEDQGISKSLKLLCDQLVSIPITGSVECLNISVACGIMLYEMLKFR